MSESELRRLRERVSIRKHFEDAYRATCSQYEPARLQDARAAYLSLLFDVHHVNIYGLTRGGLSVDLGAPQSKPPKDFATKKPAPAVRACDLWREEQRWMRADLAAIMLKRADVIQGKLDGIVGESAL